MLRTLTVYVDRLLAKHGTVEHETLDMLYWLLGREIVNEDLIPLAAMLSDEGRKRRFDPEYTEDIRHSRHFSHIMDTALHKLGRNEQNAVADLFRGLLKKRQNQLKYKGISDIERNLDAFQRIFGLSDVETDLSLFFLIVSVYEEAESLFGYRLKCDQYAGRAYLATCRKVTPPIKRYSPATTLDYKFQRL
jgi:transitional endoplasmic reticulum ATPase